MPKNRLTDIPQAPSDAKLIIEACRSNNTDLLSSIIEKCPNPEVAAKALNEAQTVMGTYAYHEAALRGNCEIFSCYTLYHSTDTDI